MENLCPVWVGYFLANPLRKLVHNPKKILGPHVKPGMTVLDVGSAMGFFSIPAAKMAGKTGHIICVDCQEKMLNTLENRAKKANVSDRITPHPCSTTSLRVESLKSRVDVALAFAMIHESPNPAHLLSEIVSTLKPNGKLLVSEPKMHVSKTQIDETLDITRSLGMDVIETPTISGAVSFVFEKTASDNRDGDLHNLQ